MKVFINKPTEPPPATYDLMGLNEQQALFTCYVLGQSNQFEAIGKQEKPHSSVYFALYEALSHQLGELQLRAKLMNIRRKLDAWHGRSNDHGFGANRAGRAAKAATFSGDHGLD